MGSDTSRQSRRKLLLGAGAGPFVLLTARTGAAADQELLPAPQFVLGWGGSGAGMGEFSACVRVAIGPEDEVYGTEFRNERVQRITPGDASLLCFPSSPKRAVSQWMRKAASTP